MLTTSATSRGPEPLAYVISLNLKRRHLSESQRAMVAAKLAKLEPGRPSKTADISAVSQQCPPSNALAQCSQKKDRRAGGHEEQE
jgi:hypothetical protein